MKPDERQQPARLSEGVVDQLVTAYLGGASAAKCAEMFGVHEKTVRTHLARRDIERRASPRKLDDADVDAAARRYQAGESFAAIARSLHVSPDTVARALKRAGRR